MSNHKKISPEIFNAQADALARLAQAFPSAVKDGELDFTALREELGQFEEVGAEKYELTWAGKQAAKKLAQTDAAGRTLKYVPDDSKDADTTQNLYIEGDNLEVLKLLRQNYYGAVKMIYIDPPYNTGNDFVYRDNFSENKADSDEAEGETESGERMVVNQKSTNRYHANWLNMMMPRLRIAKDLLTNDGVIFISIDDNEVKNLRAICDEIFGEENFVAEIVWKHTQQSKNDERHFSRQYNYNIVYAKNILTLPYFNFERTEEDNKNYSNPDNDPKGMWRSGDVRSPNYRRTLCFDIVAPNGAVIKAPENGWRWSEDTIKEKIQSGEIIFKKDFSGIIRKIYLCEQQGRTPENLWDGERFGTTRQATASIKELFNGVAVFDTPKPKELVMSMMRIASRHGDIILDFFSGSATTAHAVMQLNAEDGGNRRFIMIQWPEETPENSEAYKTGYKNICEIGKERIRRAGDKIKAEIEKANQQLTIDGEAKQVPDIGFRVFRTADTNIRWTHEAIKGQLDLAEAELSDQDRMDFMPGYTDIDVVYEVLLHQRDIPLSAKIEKLNIGNRTYLFADAYVVCLDETITAELIEALAAIEPTPIKYIIRDSAFNDDISLKDESMRRLEAYVSRNTGDKIKAYTVEFI